MSPVIVRALGFCERIITIAYLFLQRINSHNRIPYWNKSRVRECSTMTALAVVSMCGGDGAGPASSI
jgi:hypothetical protein